MKYLFFSITVMLVIITCFLLYQNHMLKEKLRATASIATILSTNSLDESNNGIRYINSEFDEQMSSKRSRYYSPFIRAIRINAFADSLVNLSKHSHPSAQESRSTLAKKRIKKLHEFVDTTLYLKFDSVQLTKIAFGIEKDISWQAADDSLIGRLENIIIRQLQYESINYLFNNWILDITEAMPMPLIYSDKNVVKLGEKYFANIALGDFNTQEKMSVDVDGKEISVRNGMGEYETVPTSLGLHEYQGDIKIKDERTGEEKKYHFRRNYYVVPK